MSSDDTTASRRLRRATNGIAAASWFVRPPPAGQAVVQFTDGIDAAIDVFWSGPHAAIGFTIRQSIVLLSSASCVDQLSTAQFVMLGVPVGVRPVFMFAAGVDTLVVAEMKSPWSAGSDACSFDSEASVDWRLALATQFDSLNAL